MLRVREETQLWQSAMSVLASLPSFLAHLDVILGSHVVLQSETGKGTCLNHGGGLVLELLAEKAQVVCGIGGKRLLEGFLGSIAGGAICTHKLGGDSASKRAAATAIPPESRLTRQFVTSSVTGIDPVPPPPPNHLPDPPTQHPRQISHLDAGH
jgi:hypothetical protein